MSALAEHLIDLQETAMCDPAMERIDAHLAFLAAEDAAAGRRAEYQQLQALVEIGNLAYHHTHPELFLPPAGPDSSKGWPALSTTSQTPAEANG